MSSLTHLGTRRARRITVGLALAITALLSAVAPTSLDGFGILLVLALAALDVVLVDATAGLAFTRARRLDERERALRDAAYRRAFRLLGVAIVAWLVIFYVTAVLSVAVAPGSGPGTGWLATGISGRGLVAIAEILLMAPTMVIAWAAGDRPAPARSSRLLWLAVPGVLVAWLAVVASAPVQAAGLSSNELQESPAGATCAHFAAGRIVGDQFGAVVGLRAEVCWNGHDAFVYGDPRIPLPQSEVDLEKKADFANAPPGVADQFMSYDPPLPDESGCGGDNRDDFETVTGMRCTAVIDGAGTLHYAVRAQVSGPLGLGDREVSLTLVVDRTGRVLQRP